MSTPPSSDSPYEYDYVPTQAELDRAAEIQRKQRLIAITVLAVEKLSKENFIISLVNILKDNNISLIKRTLIAEAVNSTIGENNIDSAEIKQNLVQTFETAVFNSQSQLYQALNYQQNWLFPITFFGSKKAISWNFAKSLQSLQLLLEKQNPGKYPKS